MNKDERIEALKATIKWLVDERVVGQHEAVLNPTTGQYEYYGPMQFSEAGCGCCGGGTLTPPPDIATMLAEVFE